MYVESRTIKCDTCVKAEETDTEYGLLSATNRGWFSLITNNPEISKPRRLDFCCVDCLMNFVERLVSKK